MWLHYMWCRLDVSTAGSAPTLLKYQMREQQEEMFQQRLALLEQGTEGHALSVDCISVHMSV